MNNPMPGNVAQSKRQGSEAHNPGEGAALSSPQKWRSALSVLVWLLPVAILIRYALGPWGFYPHSDDQEITDNGLSFLAGYFNPHWFGYGYLTFVVSAVASLGGFVWGYASGETENLHAFLVRSMAEPVEVLVANRIVFFSILCVGLVLLSVYVARHTSKSWAGVFLLGMLLTQTVGNLRFLIKLQSLELVWMALALLLTERIYKHPNGTFGYVLGGMLCGCAMSTGISGAVLVTAFAATIVAVQLGALVQHQLPWRTAVKNTAITAVALCVSYIATSPTVLFAFDEWYPAHVKWLLGPGTARARPWTQPRALSEHLQYISSSAIFPGSITVLGAAAFGLLQIHRRSLRFLLLPLYSVIGLTVFLRSPHLMDYYLLSTVAVLNVMCVLLVWELAAAGRSFLAGRMRLAAWWPQGAAYAVVGGCVVVLGGNAEVVRGWRSIGTMETDPRIQARDWIEENLPDRAMLVIDGWAYHAPRILCTDPAGNRTLWDHSYFGRQKNTALQELSHEAWKSLAESGRPMYECVFSGFNVLGHSYQLRKVLRIQKIISQWPSDVYWVISNRWSRTWTRDKVRMSAGQRPFREYYRRWLNGEFGPLVRRGKARADSTIIRVNRPVFAEAFSHRE